MSKYTTEVRFICETYAGMTESQGYGKVAEIIEAARPKVFNFDYPIFDESYRKTLETKILKHYYTREIGFETVGLWQLKLDTLLNEVMPYFNQRYKSETLEFNPLYDFDVTRDHTNTKEEQGSTNATGQNTSSSTDTGMQSGERKNKFSDTPQGALTNVENGTYLTTAEVDNTETNTSGSTESTSNGTTSSTSNINSTEDFVEHVKGKQGGTSYSKMLQEYRQTMLNIDMEVIESLSGLFMLLW